MEAVAAVATMMIGMMMTMTSHPAETMTVQREESVSLVMAQVSVHTTNIVVTALVYVSGATERDGIGLLAIKYHVPIAMSQATNLNTAMANAVSVEAMEFVTHVVVMDTNKPSC